MTTSDREVVAALEQAIVQRIGEPRFSLWFARRTKFVWDDGQLTVGVPNLHFQEWLQKTFADAVRAAAAEVFGESRPVRFVIDPELFQAARQEQEEERRAGEARRSQSAGSPVLHDEQPGGLRPPLAEPRKGKKKQPAGPTLFDGLVPEPLPRKVEPRTRPARRWHKLSEFVVGPCNRVAHASALSVVEEPGQAANPLVLHGPVGTGKTHLLEGIYAGLRRARAETGASCTSPPRTSPTASCRRCAPASWPSFRKQFRECDALLVDDLHFLAGKKATQEEFLHTFDALLADGRQLVVTCDCHPRLADEFTPGVDRPPAGRCRLGPDAARRRHAPGHPPRQGGGRVAARPRRRAAPPGRAAARQRPRAGRGACTACATTAA